MQENIVIGNKWWIWLFDWSILHTLFAPSGKKVKLSDLHFSSAQTIEHFFLNYQKMSTGGSHAQEGDGTMGV